MRAWSAALLIAGCSAEQSVVLHFPNAAAEEWTAQIRIETFDLGRDVCANFLEDAAEGRLQLGNRTRTATFPFPFQEVTLESVPRRPQVFVFFASTGNGIPFLGGCEEMDGEVRELSVALQHIPYDFALEVAGGDRQIGRPGERLARPLVVQVTAVVDGRPSPIPGLEILFQRQGELPFTLGEGEVRSVVHTGGQGEAGVMVDLPLAEGSGSVHATSSAIRAQEATFTVSSLAPPEVTSRSLSVPGVVGAPIQLAVGRFEGEARLIILGCDGSPLGCTPGRKAEPPLGRGTLAIIQDPLGVPSLVAARGDLGSTPAGVAVSDFLPAEGDEIALVNSRRADRQGAEVRLLGLRGNELVLLGQYALTGSSAVGVTAFRSAEGMSIAVAAQGRAEHLQACEMGLGCMAGCPPDEYCSQGVCVKADDRIDILDPSGGTLVERDRCHRVESSCGPTGAFTCLDPLGSALTVEDDCGCKVASGLRIGARLTLEPSAIIRAPLRGAVDDLVVATIGGLYFAQWQGSRYTIRAPPTLQQSTLDVTAVRLDADAFVDFAWIEAQPCLRGANFESPCPLTREPEAEHHGCLGSYQSDGFLPLLQPPICSRIPLEVEPLSVCGGRRREQPFIAVAGSDRVSIYAGDGLGGLLDPPVVVPLPNVGPILCAELDTGGPGQIFVADRSTAGRYHLLELP